MLKMTSVQLCLPHASVGGPYAYSFSASNLPTYTMMPYKVFKLQTRQPYDALSSQRCRPVCAFGHGGKPGNGNETSPWKAIEGIVGGFRKQLTVQDVLKEQKKRKELEFDDDDDGGDGKGTESGGDGSGGGEDGGFVGALNEFLQVILAAAGFAFLYFYIINGEEFSRLVKDYIRYLFGGRKSVRLTNALDRWESFLENFDAPAVRSDWLEREILATPTWWYDPEWQRQGRSRGRMSY